jgi:Tfp pilus assembly protein PilF
MAFDPVFDLSAVRLTYALRRSLEITPDDFLPLLILAEAYRARGMNQAAVPVVERLLTLTPINGIQAEQQTAYRAQLAALRASIGPPPRSTWENRSQLNELVNDLLNEGRAEAAADVLERATPADARAWDETDRLAVLRLHLGEPARARALWQAAPAPPRPAVRDARVAVTHLVEGSFDAARQSFRAAIAADPNLFEAHYGLAVLEQDAGRASEALTAARKAVSLAPRDPTDVARTAAQGIVATVTPYAGSAIADDVK